MGRNCRSSLANAEASYSVWGKKVKTRALALRTVFARKVAAGLRGINPKLEEQFDEAARAADRSFRPAS